MLLPQTHGSWAPGAPCLLHFHFGGGCRGQGSHRPGGGQAAVSGKSLSQSQSLTSPHLSTPGGWREKGRNPNLSEVTNRIPNTVALRLGFLMASSGLHAGTKSDRCAFPRPGAGRRGSSVGQNDREEQAAAPPGVCSASSTAAHACPPTGLGPVSYVWRDGDPP